MESIGLAAPSELTSIKQLHLKVWYLAWPAVITTLLQTFNGMMDTRFVGHLSNSAQSLTATGTGGQIIFILTAVALGISISINSLVAQAMGAGNISRVREAVEQSISLSLVAGLILGSIVLVMRPQIVTLILGNDATAKTSALLCIQFLFLPLLATPLSFLLNALQGVFRGMGDTRTPLQVQCAMIAVHILCDYTLIYGNFGFPKLGVYGAGAALALSISTGTVLLFYRFLVKTDSGMSFAAGSFLPDKNWYLKILRIAIPGSMRSILRILAMMSMTGLLAHSLQATSSIAALNIGIPIEAISFMPGVGYSIAAATLVGQYLGASNIKMGIRCANAAAGQGMVIMSIAATVMFAGAQQLSQIFTTDTSVIVLTADYLRINALSEPFIALNMIFNGAMQGAGDTLRPFLITFVCLWLIRIPLSWILMFTLHLNTIGAWYSIAVSSGVGGVVASAVFSRKGWIKKEAIRA